MKGERRTKNRGTSVEFADFRNYVLGDEPRFVDWNTYARLEKLFLKLFLEEEDLYVYFLIDTTGSMAFGEPSKLLYARRVAAALAYVSLLSLDRVVIAGFGTGMRHTMRPRRGRSSTRDIFEFLQSMEAEGETSLEQAARRFAASVRRSGVVILVSDFLDKNGYETALRQLLHKRCEVYAIHVLSDEELRPAVTGDLRLVDSEDGSVTEVTVTDRLLRRYHDTVAEFCANLRAFCLKRGIHYVAANTNTPFEELVLRYFKLSGLLK
jgi:uncharacterized protein (DUF58 family)